MGSLPWSMPWLGYDEMDVSVPACYGDVVSLNDDPRLLPLPISTSVMSSISQNCPADFLFSSSTSLIDAITAPHSFPFLVVTFGLTDIIAFVQLFSISLSFQFNQKTIKMKISVLATVTALALPTVLGQIDVGSESSFEGLHLEDSLLIPSCRHHQPDCRFAW